MDLKDVAQTVEHPAIKGKIRLQFNAYVSGSKLHWAYQDLPHMYLGVSPIGLIRTYL